MRMIEISFMSGGEEISEGGSGCVNGVYLC